MWLFSSGNCLVEKFTLTSSPASPPESFLLFFVCSRFNCCLCCSYFLLLSSLLLSLPSSFSLNLILTLLFFILSSVLSFTFALHKSDFLLPPFFILFSLSVFAPHPPPLLFLPFLNTSLCSHLKPCTVCSVRFACTSWIQQTVNLRKPLVSV